MGDNLLIMRDELDGVLHLGLGVLRQRPVGQIEPPPHRVDRHVQAHQRAIGSVADIGEPAVRQRDDVEFIAMQHQQAAAVGGFVDRLAADLDPAEIEAGELPEHLVMIAGDIDDAGATLGALQDAPDDVVMRGGPVEALLQAPAVDDVADQIQRVAVDVVEEIDQHVGVAAARAQVDVGNPDRAVAASLDDALRDGRSRLREIGDRRGGDAGVHDSSPQPTVVGRRLSQTFMTV